MDGAVMERRRASISVDSAVVRAGGAMLAALGSGFLATMGWMAVTLVSLSSKVDMLTQQQSTVQAAMQGNVSDLNRRVERLEDRVNSYPVLGRSPMGRE